MGEVCPRMRGDIKKLAGKKGPVLPITDFPMIVEPVIFSREAVIDSRNIPLHICLFLF